MQKMGIYHMGIIRICYGYPMVMDAEWKLNGRELLRFLSNRKKYIKKGKGYKKEYKEEYKKEKRLAKEALLVSFGRADVGWYPT